MTRRKADPRNHITCEYCEVYQNANQRRAEVVGNSKNWFRTCPKSKCEVQSHTPAAICKHFNLTIEFWCNKGEQWQYCVACLNRMNKGLCSANCKQGKVIASTYKSLEPEVHERKIIL